MPDPTAVAAARAATSAAADDFRSSGSRVVAVDSPPGAGKSTFVRSTAAALAEEQQVPIVAQTNAQSDDLSAHLARDFDLTVGRLHRSSNYRLPTELSELPNLVASANVNDLRACDVVVATARKWAYTARRVPVAFGVGIIDEAYQMRSEGLLFLGPIMRRLLVVGDPGQLDPFTEVDVSHWSGHPNNPVATAVDVLRFNYEVPVHRLPVSWRLPHSAASVVAGAFYPDLPFRAGTVPDERQMEFAAVGMGSVADAAIEQAAVEGWAWVELPARFVPPVDSEVIDQIVVIARRLLERAGHTLSETTGRRGRPLTADRIAIGVTRTMQRNALQAAVDEQLLPLDLGAEDLTVDTANRLQGREYDVTIVWHPLSGRRDADSFYLESGRLCVLTSRHRHACIVVGRSGIGDLLDNHPVAEPYFVGTRDVAVSGWEAHQAIAAHLETVKVA